MSCMANSVNADLSTWIGKPLVYAQLESSKYENSTQQIVSLLGAVMVPEAGLEPARPFEQQILSLLCLPIPSLRQSPRVQLPAGIIITFGKAAVNAAFFQHLLHESDMARHPGRSQQFKHSCSQKKRALSGKAGSVWKLQADIPLGRNSDSYIGYVAISSATTALGNATRAWRSSSVVSARPPHTWEQTSISTPAAAARCPACSAVR